MASNLDHCTLTLEKLNLANSWLLLSQRGQENQTFLPLSLIKTGTLTASIRLTPVLFRVF